jgi:hypothetical protein
MYFLSFIISDAEKIYRQSISSNYVREFQAEVRSRTGDKLNVKGIYAAFPSPYIIDRGLSYPTIADDWASANYYGLSLHSVYGYDTDILVSSYSSIDDIYILTNAAPKGYAILIAYPDGSLQIE